MFIFLFFREKCYFNKNLKGRILGLFTIKLIFNWEKLKKKTNKKL